MSGGTRHLTPAVNIALKYVYTKSVTISETPCIILAFIIVASDLSERVELCKRTKPKVFSLVEFEVQILSLLCSHSDQKPSVSRLWNK
jgi:hypothetical protein